MRLMEQITGARFMISGITTIGRDRGVTINVNEITKNPAFTGVVSKVHAKLTVRGDGDLEVEDLDSTNGIRVNDTPIPRGSSMLVTAGDSIGIGAFEFLVVDAWPVQAASNRALAG